MNNKTNELKEKGYRIVRKKGRSVMSCGYVIEYLTKDNSKNKYEHYHPDFIVLAKKCPKDGAPIMDDYEFDETFCIKCKTRYSHSGKPLRIPKNGLERRAEQNIPGFSWDD